MIKNNNSLGRSVWKHATNRRKEKWKGKKWTRRKVHFNNWWWSIANIGKEKEERSIHVKNSRQNFKNDRDDNKVVEKKKFNETFNRRGEIHEESKKDKNEALEYRSEGTRENVNLTEREETRKHDWWKSNRKK